MKIRNITREEIEKALADANETFDNNLTFKRLDEDGQTRQGGQKFIVTLTVKNSAASGGRVSPGGRRISAACWHAHGTFMDALPAETEIAINWVKGCITKHPGDPWEDWQIRSNGISVMASESCHCE